MIDTGNKTAGPAPAAAVSHGHDFSGRVALVTGGSGVIGSAIVAALREGGATVVSVDGTSNAAWREAGARELASQVLRLDVTDGGAIAGLVERVNNLIGPVDSLVNVAGVASFGSAQNLAEAEWDRVIDINLKGSFLACQVVMAGMKERRFGRILNIGSVVAKNMGNARPWIDPAEQERAGNIAYGVSKAGVHALTGYLSKELAAHGVTVNAVAPGPISTPMTTNFPAHLRALIPVGRMGEAADVAHAALFLLSRQSGFITGEIIDVNGGMFCD